MDDCRSSEETMLRRREATSSTRPVDTFLATLVTQALSEQGIVFAISETLQDE
jgi:hypothetical protein